MNTFFAPAAKATNEELQANISLVSEHPVLTGLLQSVSGLLAVLNEKRQIVAMNDAFMQMLGIDDPAKALGLRPGEALRCVHGNGEPNGCGTTEYCSTCGAAVSIVASLGRDVPAERICALKANRGNREVDIALLVKAHPIAINGRKFLLLIVHDITQQQQRAALERVFFHDINNMLTALVGASDLLIAADDSLEARTVHEAARRLEGEVAIQRCLSRTGAASYRPTWTECTAAQVVDRLRTFFDGHPTTRTVPIDFTVDCPAAVMKTDIALLLRVLSNMVINALEASTEGDRVALRVSEQDASIVFEVRNPGAIDEDIQKRVFQRNFSTKPEAGRGIGTWSMKIFGESILGGNVDFTSSAEDGTVFRFVMPMGCKIKSS